MKPYISWPTYSSVLMVATAVYYVVYGGWCLYRRSRVPVPPQPPSLPQTPDIQVWMEDILLDLEKTVRHAQRLRYHPDEVILLLQKKIENIKSKWI